MKHQQRRRRNKKNEYRIQKQIANYPETFVTKRLINCEFFVRTKLQAKITRPAAKFNTLHSYANEITEHRERLRECESEEKYGKNKATPNERTNERRKIVVFFFVVVALPTAANKPLHDNSHEKCQVK